MMREYFLYLALGIVTVFLLTLPLSILFHLLTRWERRDRPPPSARAVRIGNIFWLTLAALIVGGIAVQAVIYFVRRWF